MKKEIQSIIEKTDSILKGSGNFGHTGRPGLVGGSGRGGGEGVNSSKGTDEIKQVSKDFVNWVNGNLLHQDLPKFYSSVKSAINSGVLDKGCLYSGTVYRVQKILDDDELKETYAGENGFVRKGNIVSSSKNFGSIEKFSERYNLNGVVFKFNSHKDIDVGALYKSLLKKGGIVKGQINPEYIEREGEVLVKLSKSLSSKHIVAIVSNGYVEKKKEIQSIIELIKKVVKDQLEDTSKEKRWKNYIKRNAYFEKKITKVFTDIFEEEMEMVISQLEDPKKKEIQSIIEKTDLIIKVGAAGSGSWSGKGQPRFPWKGKDPREEGKGNRPPRVTIEKGRKVIRTKDGDVLVETKRKPDKMGTDKKGNPKLIRGELTMMDGSPLPDHAYRGTKPLAPMWSYVYINMNPDGKLIAEGVDSKGKYQPSYNKKFAEQRSVQKFIRVKGLEKNFEKNYKKVDKDAENATGSKREAASCLRLVMSTGIRPTDENDNPKPDKDAYGAVTMLGKHVFVKGKDVIISLPAKKGTTYTTKIRDAKVAVDLLKRKRQSGNEGRIFDTKESKVLAYSKEKTGYIIKDYRTHIANKVAVKVLKEMPKPTTEKEFKQQRNKVGDIVSAVLCNGRSMALGSYIDPLLFEARAKGIKFKKKELIIEYNIIGEEYIDLDEIEVKGMKEKWEDLTVDDFNVEEIMKDPTPIYDDIKIEDEEIYTEVFNDMTEEEKDVIINETEPDDRTLELLHMTREEYNEMKKEEEGKGSINKKELVMKIDMTKNDWLEAWKKDPHWAKLDVPSKFAKAFIRLMKKEKLGKNILEVGCGNGRDSIYFAKQGYDVIAIDLSPDAIKIAEENAEKAGVKNIKFAVKDIEKWDGGNIGNDIIVDGVYSMSVLHSTNMKKSIKNIVSMMNEKAIASFYLYVKSEYGNKTEVNFKIKDVEEIFKNNNLVVFDKYRFEVDDKDEKGEHTHYGVVYILKHEKDKQ